MMNDGNPQPKCLLGDGRHFQIAPMTNSCNFFTVQPHNFCLKLGMFCAINDFKKMIQFVLDGVFRKRLNVVWLINHNFCVNRRTGQPVERKKGQYKNV